MVTAVMMVYPLSKKEVICGSFAIGGQSDAIVLTVKKSMGNYK